MAQTATKPLGPERRMNAVSGGTIRQSPAPTVSSTPSMVAVAAPFSARKTSSLLSVCGGLDSPGASASEPAVSRGRGAALGEGRCVHRRNDHRQVSLTNAAEKVKHA